MRAIGSGSAWRRAAAAACAAVSLLGNAAHAAEGPASPPQPHVVLDPHYGDALFHFYQDHYFSSITTLMVSQHFGRVSHHEDDAEILRGGMLLSYGLHREAGEIFAQLIDSTTPSVRNRAWYYLAKIRYQRGLGEQAEAALARIDGKLPGDLEEERALLHSQLLMARNDYAQAAAVLNSLAANAATGRYARFNLGVALVKSGELARGSALLDELGKSYAPDEEFRSLRDKANVALGFAALQDEKPEAARTYLERVRLQGAQSNKALLGFGWASAAMKEPEQALVPWNELLEREPSDAAVLEARIAVPQALLDLGAYGQALDRYYDAISAFDKARTDLDESIAAIRGGKLVSGLLERNPGDEMGWFWSIREVPQMPHAGHLTGLLARHDFQEAFKNYRDLQFLAKNLEDWQSRLGVYGDMLAARRQAYAERLPNVRDRAQSIGLETLKQRRDDVAAGLAQAEQDADGVAFADKLEQDLMQRLARVQEVLARHGSDGGDGPAVRERLRLAAGALTWRLAEQYPARAWEAKKTMKALDAELAGARHRDVLLARAQQDEPKRFDAFAERIAELDRRLRGMTPQVLALSREQQQYVQELAVAELDRQKERLNVYKTQARFAIAQLHDRANIARSPSP